MIVGIDTEHTADEPMAEQMLADLCRAYPGHAWFVIIRGGIVQVKNMDFNDKWGMTLHYSELKADANDRKKQILKGAGEFLERANVIRGAKTGEKVLHIEGIPDKHMTRAGL